MPWRPVGRVGAREPHPVLGGGLVGDRDHAGSVAGQRHGLGEQAGPGGVEHRVDSLRSRGPHPLGPLISVTDRFGSECCEPLEIRVTSRADLVGPVLFRIFFDREDVTDEFIDAVVTQWLATMNAQPPV